MTRSGRVGLYSDRKYFDMPQAGLDEILAAARRNGARYLVVDGMLVWQRPQLGILLAPLLEGKAKVLLVSGGDEPEVIPGVRPYLLYKDPTSLGVMVYRVE